MKPCHTNSGPYLYNSCDPSMQLDRLQFQVDPGEAAVLAVHGLPAGQTIPIQMAVGPLASALWTPLTSGGVTAALSATNTTVNIVTPGWYRIDVSGVVPEPGTCVYVTAGAVDAEVACCLPSPFSPPGGSATSIVAATPTGLVDTATGMPIYSTLDSTGSVVEQFYFDPITGAKVVTNTGFQKAVDQTTVEAVAYETLSTGQIERLNKYVVVANGVPGTPFYTRFWDGSPYTPVDLHAIAPKPQKMRMGEETFDVTGTSTKLPNIPTGLTNSQGQEFPQHAYVHVEVDKDNTAAGIAYTTDGTDPAESPTAKEFEVSAGNGFSLDTNQEIVEFRAVPLNAIGEPDPSLTVQLSVEYNNIDEDKDDI